MVVIVPADGPDIFVQPYDATVPSASVPLPVNEMVLVGNVIDWSVPAFAVGGMLAAALTVI